MKPRDISKVNGTPNVSPKRQVLAPNCEVQGHRQLLVDPRSGTPS